jgi:hypothetical protein
MKNFSCISFIILATLPNVAFAQTRPTTVIELYTSQGCSSCPPANDNLAALAGRSDILALSFGVTYWDYLGWRDSFALSANNDRQIDYVRAMRQHAPYTPQMVINGRADTTGIRRDDIFRVARAAPIVQGGPTLNVSGTSIMFGATAPSQAATIWMVRYDPRTIQVPIKRGENNGKTLPHTNVVREFVRVGTYQGVAMRVTLPESANANLKTAILVQRGAGGPIISALVL